MNICAIDPGPKQSSYVLVEHNYTLLEVDDITNDSLLDMLADGGGIETNRTIDIVLIEQTKSYYQIASNDLIDTIRFEGRLWQKCLGLGLPCHLIPRKEYGRAIVGRGTIDDTTLYKALKLRAEFGKQLPLLKSSHSHRRSAFAMAAYYLDKKKTGGG